MTGRGKTISRDDMLGLARALGCKLPAEVTLRQLYHACLERAEELGRPVRLFELTGRTHPKVQEFCRLALDWGRKRKERLEAETPLPTDPEKWIWHSVVSAVRDGAGGECDHAFVGHSSLCCLCGKAEDEIAELAADGDLPKGEDGIGFPARTVDEWGANDEGADRQRQNAEQWARTRGARTG